MIDYLNTSKAKPIEIYPSFLKLGLSSKQLMVYAIIRQFCVASHKKRFSGSLKYLEQWTCSSRQGVINALKALEIGGFIEKEIVYLPDTNIKRNLYYAYAPEELAFKLSEENKALYSNNSNKAKKSGRNYTKKELEKMFPDIEKFNIEI